ncbi:MAG: C39 family peptidase [Candidatus Paceibacterota bacterium]
MKLNVPYYSQFIDVSDRYWMPRACLITCLKMVLNYYGKAEDVSIDDLIKKGQDIGGYGKSGWFHDSIVALAKDLGLEVHREEKIDTEEGLLHIKGSIDKNDPVIVSIVKDILGQKKFHTVVITGYEEKDGKISGFYFHDPESTSDERNREAKFVDTDIFKSEWRRMAIFFGK